MLHDELQCPVCFSMHTVRSGHLPQEFPDSPILDPPPELRLCRTCRALYRADGEPYDEAACREAWKLKGETNES